MRGFPLVLVSTIAAILLAVFVGALIVVATGGSPEESSEPSAANDSAPTPLASITASVTTTVSPAASSNDRSTPPNFRVAFLGDQGLEASSRAVLSLVKAEGAQALLILGDFDYEDNPNAWDAMLNQQLGAGFPVFAVVGNHDEERWPQYRAKLSDRLAKIAGANCSGDYGVNAACSYQGLFFILSGAGSLGSGHAGFIRERLAGDDSVWSVCAWHKNQEALQLGEKDDETGWDVYEQCRVGGAIIATAHEHSYQRTKTLSNTRSQAVDQAWSSPAQLRVGGGSTFVFVSGLGGRSIREQARCQPVSAPYGCSGIWASIYTEDQNANYGALFIDFHVDGDPRKARGYFKNIRGQTIDSFTIVAEEP
jgi:hypothetical protein